jgi:LPS sulfotransferase NodH
MDADSQAFTTSVFPMHSNPQESVIIVAGLPRSGTSMMMRILEAGGVSALTDGVREADISNPRGYYEFEPVKRTKTDPSWLSSASGKAVKMVYRLLYDLPPIYYYRVLLMRRTLKEVLSSQRAMLQHQQNDDAVEDAKMIEIYQRELANLETWFQKQANFSKLDVNYNELVKSPGLQVARISEFLGMDLDQAAMAGVVDIKLYRNRL